MMGLFLLLPVMSIAGQELSGATPLLIGVAIGIYGLFQAFLQIPFGLLSDRYGRKPLIYLGLILLIIGSLIAAAADSIWGVIVGRALQGAGAISAAVIALAADLTRDDQRTKMMAIIGASIGASFILSIMLGPVLMTVVGLNGIFLAIALLGTLSLLVMRFLVPQPRGMEMNRDVSVVASQLRNMLTHPQLVRLDIGILFLHFLITATFVCVPLGLVERSIAPDSHWQVYFMACVLSLLIVVPMVGFGEARWGVRRVMIVSIVGLALSEFLIGAVNDNWWLVVGSLVVFFGFLNVLEAILPSLVSRIAPAASRGSAMGVYSTSQFLGAFLGGVFGGWIHGAFGLGMAHVVIGVLCLAWLVVVYGMTEPEKLASYRASLPTDSSLAPTELKDRIGRCKRQSNPSTLKSIRKNLTRSNFGNCCRKPANRAYLASRRNNSASYAGAQRHFGTQVLPCEIG
jgi:MFS family permease